MPRPASRSAGWISLLLLLSACATAQPQNPFSVSADLQTGTNRPARLDVTIAVPSNHYLYADSVSVEATDAELTPVSTPTSQDQHDPFRDKTVAVYSQDVRWRYTLDAAPPQPLEVTVAYQGCSSTLCYMPTTTTLRLHTNGTAQTTTGTNSVANGAPNDWQALADRFSVVDRASGYLKPDDFVAFLQSARTGGEQKDRASWQRIVAERGWLVSFVLIILGGLALNLTPCVLPMIPVNLAIIGAGSQAASRRQGFLLGGAYGLGMALAYGILGLIVLLTGSQFGALNASPWFNATVAVLFVLLALAITGVIPLDFSKLQSKAGDIGGEKKGHALLAVFFGGVMALLAGACVAPVVVSVLLFATDLYAGGNQWALFLPFLLGIGMALPWPFAGAGLSFLPKPGRWMQAIKYLFGVIVLGFAIYYGYRAVTLFRHHRPDAKASVAATRRQQIEKGPWLTSLPVALRRGLAEDKPVLIDFWATWCKSCLKMDRTTFSDAAVQSALEEFVSAKFQAEDPDASQVKQVLDHFDVVGLPSYVVLKPGKQEGGGHHVVD